MWKFERTNKYEGNLKKSQANISPIALKFHILANFYALKTLEIRIPNVHLVKIAIENSKISIFRMLQHWSYFEKTCLTQISIRRPVWGPSVLTYDEA